MADLLFTILTLTVALLFTRYMAYYIVYFVAKFVSKGKINMVIHPITFGDVLCTAMACLLLSFIFKIVGII